MVARVLVALAAWTLMTAGVVVAAGPTFTNPLNVTNPYQPFTVGAVKVYNGKKDLTG
jgi:hypothetical protein